MITTSVLALLGIGASAAVILAVASRLLRVEENPKVELVTEALPGANCGGCGFAGCEAYAVAVVTNQDIPANLCSVGGADVAAKVGELSGKAVIAGEPMVSFRRCSRVEGNVRARFEYVGTQTCASAAMLEGGPYMCAWACLGLGDCMRTCPFDAMYIVNGMVEIIPSKCVSCGQCVKACPRGITQLIPRRARMMIHCSTREKMKSVSDVCEVGCINCLKCLKACPADAILYEKGRMKSITNPASSTARPAAKSAFHPVRAALCATTTLCLGRKFRSSTSPSRTRPWTATCTPSVKAPSLAKVSGPRGPW